MKEVYPDYADSVRFYAVGYDPFEDLERLQSYRQEQGYPWPMAVAQGDILRDLDVVIQSTKIAFDSQGVITYRAGYYRGGPEEWREVFDELSASQMQSPSKTTQ